MHQRSYDRKRSKPFCISCHRIGSGNGGRSSDWIFTYEIKNPCDLSLYSVNIRIMGQPNTSLLGEDTAFTQAIDALKLDQTMATLLVGAVISIFVVLCIYWFCGTELGCALRATGNNEYMVRALGANTNTSKVIGLVISNGMISVSGALVGQSQGYGDIKMGTGAIVIGLASIVIGEVIFGKRFNFMYILASVVFGSVIYRMIISLVLYMGLSTDDMKLFTALVVALALGIPAIKSRYSQKRIPGKGGNTAC